MAKLSKNLFSGDAAPDLGEADAEAQHVFLDAETVTAPVRAQSAFEKLMAISDRTEGEPLPVMAPSRVQEIEDDLDVTPQRGA